MSSAPFKMLRLLSITPGHVGTPGSSRHAHTLNFPGVGGCQSWCKVLGLPGVFNVNRIGSHVLSGGTPCTRVTGGAIWEGHAGGGGGVLSGSPHETTRAIPNPAQDRVCNGSSPRPASDLLCNVVGGSLLFVSMKPNRV